LAGTTLHFQVEVVEVRDATEEEIEESIAEAGCGCGADSQANCGCDADSQANCGCDADSNAGCGCDACS